MQPNNTPMLCDRISGTALCTFCYGRIVTSRAHFVAPVEVLHFAVMIGQFPVDVSRAIELTFSWFLVSRLKTACA